MPQTLRRRFYDVATGQLHARAGGGSPDAPLVMLHAAPGSARMLVPLAERIAAHRRVIAIDLPGMGDSSPLAKMDEPTIDDFARPIQEALSHIADGPVDVYGTLSGVRVALALANRPASKVRRVVLDGVGFPKPAEMDELLERYAPPFTPHINGTHFTDTFLLCRDQYLFYPWYARDAEHRRPNGLPSAEALHIKAMESLKSAEAFRPLIRAAFRYDCEAALKALTQPALVSADAGAVRPDLPVLEFPPAEPLTCAEDLLDKRAARIAAFLAS
jgi:pimeloyl-ACP methyl ester carboxylesterase